MTCQTYMCYTPISAQELGRIIRQDFGKDAVVEKCRVFSEFDPVSGSEEHQTIFRHYANTTYQLKLKKHVFASAWS